MSTLPSKCFEKTECGDVRSSNWSSIIYGTNITFVTHTASH